MKSPLRDNRFYLLLLILLPILMLSRILFTREILNATDVMTQYFWDVLGMGNMSLYDWLTYKWYGLSNFGGDITRVLARNLLPYRFLVYKISPPYLGISWEAALHVVFAGIGTYYYCKTLGLQKYSSFVGAISFILSSEIITLFNAGHIGKINTISWLPLIFLFLEKGLQERRVFYFLLTGGTLAIQFFELHWQISFYTCLAVGFYFIFRGINIYFEDGDIRESGRLTAYAILMVLIFFAASMISFLPTYEWAKTTERAEGMRYEDAMSWSMPPEEVVTYLIPQFFGLSRKESVTDPGYIDVFYWGRMWFTQTSRYLGIFPLILAGIALAYRRNSQVILFASMALVVLLMGMGKYTPVYRFMYHYLPGFSTFRVPAMILFLFAFSVAVLAGIGADWLFYGREEAKRIRVKRVIYVLSGLLLLSGVITLSAWLGKDSLMSTFHSALSRPSRYVYDPYLPYNRYVNIIQGALLYLFLLLASIGILWSILKERIRMDYTKVIVVLFIVGDLWFINSKFISTYKVPDITPNENIKFLKKDKELYRLFPLSGDVSEFYYTAFNIPILLGYNPVVEKEFAEMRERLSLEGRFMDLFNVKYLVISNDEFGGRAPSIGTMFLGKYMVVFNGDPSSSIALNTRYLPRVYPVHRVIVERDKDLIFNILENPRFEPRETVVLEEASPFQTDSLIPSSVSTAEVTEYSNNEIFVKTDMAQDGFLVLSEKYYPGWKAYVDGKETKIYKANYVMRAVYLTKGRHKVKFVFDPWPYKVGLWVSSATFLFLIGAVVWRVRNVRRER